MASVKVVAVGNSIGVILPKAIVQRLRVEKGDTLYVLETPKGIELTPYDCEYADQMEGAERVMREDVKEARRVALCPTNPCGFDTTRVSHSATPTGGAAR